MILERKQAEEEEEEEEEAEKEDEYNNKQTEEVRSMRRSFLWFVAGKTHVQHWTVL